MDARDPELTEELDATLQTRRELGPEYEEELIASFLEKIDQRLETVVDKRMRRQMAEQQMAVARGARARRRGSALLPGGHGPRLLAVASLVLAVPLSAIAAVNTGFAGLLVCWGGIVAVNAVQANRSWLGLRPRQGAAPGQRLGLSGGAGTQDRTSARPCPRSERRPTGRAGRAARPRQAGKRSRAGAAAPRCGAPGRDDGSLPPGCAPVRTGRVRGVHGGPGAAPEFLDADDSTTVRDGC